MADILIRGMEMPTDQYGKMVITIYPDGHVVEYAGDIARVWDAVLLPDGHGRLVDADDTLKRIPIPTEGASSVDIYNNIECFIETRPTVIPAEGTKDNG